MLRYLMIICLCPMIALLIAIPQIAAQESESVPLEAFQEVGEFVRGYVENDLTVGAELLVIEKGQPVFHKSYGFSDREENTEWKNDTVCNIRSMTKPITSAAAQLLIDRGQLHLEDTVAKHLVSFDNDNSREITVRQVLTHRSGLPLTNLLRPDQFSSLSEQVADAGETGPTFEPGSKFWYSDLGTDVVAAIVEKIAGEPINVFVQREIFDPLQMNDTFYGFDETDARLPSVASLYIGGPNNWNRFWKPEKPLYPFAWGSQTVYSTTTDYAKFLKMLMNEGRAGDQQLLSIDAVKRMLAPVSRTKMMGSDTPAPTEFRNLEVFYGQMMVTHRERISEFEQDAGSEKDTGDPFVIGHSGSDGTNAWAWPDRDLVILYFTQSRGGFTPLRIEGPIDRVVIHRGVTEEVPAELRPFVGSYIANYDKFENEEFVVRVSGGKLVLDVPSQLAFKLNEPDADGFRAFAIAPDQIKTEFTYDDNDEVVGLMLHKGDGIFEVPRKGTARVTELAQQRIEKEQSELPSAEGGSSAEQLVTTWEGTLNAGGTELRLEIDIIESDLQLFGQVRSLDQNNARMEMADIQLNDATISFSLPGVGAEFEGELKDDGMVAEGTFSQGGVDMELVITKTGSKIVPASTEKLREAWTGGLEIGQHRPVMQFRIMTLESGDTVAYFDSITEGQTGFEATWSIDGDQLNFDVAEIELTYRGTLNENKDSADGTWSQGGRDFPLILKKSDKAK